MSTGTTTPSSSAHNIAHYTQAISSNLGNLLSELGLASATASTSNEAIFRQLQIITEQLTKVNDRLCALEETSRKSLDRTEDVAPVELCETWTMPTLPTAEYVRIVLKLLLMLM